MYNLKSIMHNAWRLFRKLSISFSAALKMAWANAKTTAQAKAAAGITEVTHSWAGWKAAGYAVVHGSTAMYKAVVADPTTKNGTRTIAYFGIHQVQPIEA